MERSRPHRAIDFNGSFLPERVQRVLGDLSPRLQRQFPALQDEAVLAEVLEEAGRRIVRRETRRGAIEKLHAYAWVTLRSVATSRLRLGVDLIRFGGHLPKGGYDVRNGRDTQPTAPSAIHG